MYQLKFHNNEGYSEIKYISEYRETLEWFIQQEGYVYHGKFYEDTTYQRYVKKPFNEESDNYYTISKSSIILL